MYEAPYKVKSIPFTDNKLQLGNFTRSPPHIHALFIRWCSFVHCFLSINIWITNWKMIAKWHCVSSVLILANNCAISHYYVSEQILRYSTGKLKIIIATKVFLILSINPSNASSRQLRGGMARGKCKFQFYAIAAISLEKRRGGEKNISMMIFFLCVLLFT